MNSTLFNDKSDLYASARPLYPEKLFQYIASITDQHHNAWDCATGNGQAAIGLAKYFDQVEATDISENQISNAFTNSRIKFTTQPAEKTNFQDSQFDLVNVAQALHWFDFERFWSEVKRVLKPNGVFITYSYAWSSVTDEIDESIEQHLKKVIEPYWASNNKLCWDGYKSVKFPFEIINSPDFELTNYWNLEQFFNFLHTWSATRLCMENEGPEFFEQAKLEVSRFWGSSDEKRLIKTPLTVIVGKM